jgi:hypothetical protein
MARFRLQVQPFMLIVTPSGGIAPAMGGTSSVLRYHVVLAAPDGLPSTAIDCGTDGARALMTLFYCFEVRVWLTVACIPA